MSEFYGSLLLGVATIFSAWLGSHTFYQYKRFVKRRKLRIMAHSQLQILLRNLTMLKAHLGEVSDIQEFKEALDGSIFEVEFEELSLLSDQEVLELEMAVRQSKKLLISIEQREERIEDLSEELGDECSLEDIRNELNNDYLQEMMEIHSQLIEQCLDLIEKAYRYEEKGSKIFARIYAYNSHPKFSVDCKQLKDWRETRNTEEHYKNQIESLEG